MDFSRVQERAYENLKKDVLRTLFLSTLWAAGFCDALQDAYTWSGGNAHFIVNKGNWHTIKNLSNVSYAASGIILTYNFSTKKWSVPGGLRTSIGSILLHHLIWDCTYRYTRYENPFDYAPERNKHAIWYPLDNYIGLNRITGPLYDLIRALIGGYLLSE